MAENEGGGGTPWIAFLAGIILVAIVAIGIVAYSGGFNPQQQRTAELEFNMPQTDRPDIDLPEPPTTPTMPPSAEQPGAAPPQTQAPAEAPSHGLEVQPQAPPDAPGD
jgi:hypothetical protein